MNGLYVSPEDQEKIDPALSDAIGWKCIHTYPYQFQGDTNYGYIKFEDGVQVWENPKYF